MIAALIVPKNSCNSFKMWQYDWKHSNTHIVTMSLSFFFFFFWVWNFGQMWKINLKRKYLITFLFKSLNYKKDVIMSYLKHIKIYQSFIKIRYVYDEYIKFVLKIFIYKLYHVHTTCLSKVYIIKVDIMISLNVY